jgi:hypothetical protein
MAMIHHKSQNILRTFCGEYDPYSPQRYKVALERTLILKALRTWIDVPDQLFREVLVMK